MRNVVCETANTKAKYPLKKLQVVVMKYPTSLIFILFFLAKRSTRWYLESVLITPTNISKRKLEAHALIHLYLANFSFNIILLRTYTYSDILSADSTPQMYNGRYFAEDNRIYYLFNILINQRSEFVRKLEKLNRIFGTPVIWLLCLNCLPPWKKKWFLHLKWFRKCKQLKAYGN